MGNERGEFVAGKQSDSEDSVNIRDYFAAKAMACAFNEFDVMDCGDYHHQHELVAELAYAMADAMLAERAKP